jgi:hypothetical protein
MTLDIDDSADLESGNDNPLAEGEIKIITAGQTLIDACDQLDQWTVQSGNAFLSIDSQNQTEGNGCLKVYIPSGGATVLCTAANSWDLSQQKYLKTYLKRMATGNCCLYFGQNSYNEQTSGNFSVSGGSWYQKNWDISGIDGNNRSSVKYVAVVFSSNSLPHYEFVDYLYGNPGPSQIKAFDGDRVILLYPKVYSSSYIGNGTSQTITIPRKGKPSWIQIDRMTAPSVLWIDGMITGHSKRMADDTADGTIPIANITTGITDVGDCYFSVGDANAVNENGVTYFFTAIWAD